ncbi:MAG: hypothetical protein IK125_01040 [Lachnospiraceae bacterium]|nr:hypothetical protein [Lachnospiraceae bacterium]
MVKDSTIRSFRRLGALALSAIMGIALVPTLSGIPEVKADPWTKDETNTRLGLGSIGNPDKPTSSSSPWKGSYVYFGKSGDKPVRFRVLDTKEKFNKKPTLFLDCDYVLCDSPLDDSSAYCDTNTDLLNELEGDSILELSAPERASLITITKAFHNLTDMDSALIERYMWYTPRRSRIFILDLEDVMNTKYGYWNQAESTSDIASRKKVRISDKTKYADWRLRSIVPVGYDEEYNTFLSSETKINACVNNHGYIKEVLCNENCGVSPAFYVDSDDVILSSSVPAESGVNGPCYKLTVKDKDISIVRNYDDDVILEGNTLTIPFTISGKNADTVNRISILITKVDYNAWEYNSQILLYQEIPYTGDLTTGAVATCTLPDLEGEWNQYFRVYLLAENVNGQYETDYAATPYLLYPCTDVVVDLKEDTDPLPLKSEQCWAFSSLADWMKEPVVDHGGFYEDNMYVDKFDIDKDGTWDLTYYYDWDVLWRLDSCSVFGSVVIEETYLRQYGHCRSLTINFPLCKPEITKTEPTDTGVQIRWSSVSGYSSYNVYRSTSLNGTYSYLASVTGGTTKYVDKTAQGGKTYYYKVRPYKKVLDRNDQNKTIYATWSDAAKVVVLADTKLTVEPKSGVTMKLSWTAVSGATSYEIYRSTSASGPYTYVKATTGTSTSDTGLTAGTRYYYMVRAKKTVNGVAQYSKYSAAVAVALATPSMESATFKSGKGVTLNWTKASGADRYNVYKYNTSTGKYDYVASVLGGTLTYTDANGKKGDYYKVRAYKRVDGVVYYGGWSNAKAGK